MNPQHATAAALFGSMKFFFGRNPKTFFNFHFRLNRRTHLRILGLISEDLRRGRVIKKGRIKIKALLLV